MSSLPEGRRELQLLLLTWTGRCKICGQKYLMDTYKDETKSAEVSGYKELYIRPSLIPLTDALYYGLEYWKAQSDYWQRKALHEKNRFNRLPFSGLVGFMESHRRLRGFIFNFLGVTSGPLGNKGIQKSGEDTGSQMVFDEQRQQVLYWYEKAREFEHKATTYARVNDKIECSPIFRPLVWLWHRTVIRRRRIRPEDLLLKMNRASSYKSENVSDLISVVTPTYNRAYCLNRVIESLLAQSYGNWELIVVDDGSTDDTHELFKKYQDERIIFCHIPKSGVSKARNVGLSLTSGKYITFLDSDNIIDPDFLMEMHREISVTDSSVGFVYCDCHLYQDGHRIDTFSKECSTPILFQRPLIDLGTIMCKKEVFEDGELFFNEEMDKWVDYELILRIDARWGKKHLKKPLMHYFRLDDGISLALETQRDMGRNMSIIRQTKRSILKVGYVLWDYPALSQTFVHSEIVSIRKLQFIELIKNSTIFVLYFHAFFDIFLTVIR